MATNLKFITDKTFSMSDLERISSQHADEEVAVSRVWRDKKNGMLIHESVGVFCKEKYGGWVVYNKQRDGY